MEGALRLEGGTGWTAGEGDSQSSLRVADMKMTGYENDRGTQGTRCAGNLHICNEQSRM